LTGGCFNFSITMKNKMCSFSGCNRSDDSTVTIYQISMESGCPQAVPCLGNSIIKPLIKCTENTLENLGW